MVLFEAYNLCSYNKNIGNQLLVNCKCYKDSNIEDSFYKNVIQARRSYMGCLCYTSNKRKRIAHKSIPIVIGSLLDARIRGIDKIKRDRTLWGCVILKGILKIYPSFSTFDALSMHVRQRTDTLYLEWFFYVNDDGIAIKYSKKQYVLDV
jgi:hypothetical protein